MRNRLYKSLVITLITTFVGSSIHIPQAHAQGMPWMPVPGVRVSLSVPFQPAQLKGMVVHQDDALKFDFLIDKGDEELSEVQKKDEYQNLIKYFMASLTVPDDEQWVNLSPYEKNRIIEKSFAQTEMGRNLLAQDYLLKQITASLMYPEESLGKKFWDRVFTRAQQELGTTEIPMNTFNKVWILPDNATVYEKNDTVYLLNFHLKVMMEEDYLALEKNSLKGTNAPTVNSVIATQGNSSAANISSKAVREIIIPEIEREINEGKNFATLRQIYTGMILATWYKRALKESLLGQVYANKGKVKGVDSDDPKANEEIYQKYLKAYKKGVFNYIKEDVDRLTNQQVPRKYFSGGAVSFFQAMAANPGLWRKVDRAQASNDMAQIAARMDTAAVVLASEPQRKSATRLTKEALSGEMDILLRRFQDDLSNANLQLSEAEQEAIGSKRRELIGKVAQEDIIPNVAHAQFQNFLSRLRIKYGIKDRAMTVSERKRAQEVARELVASHLGTTVNVHDDTNPYNLARNETIITIEELGTMGDPTLWKGNRKRAPEMIEKEKEEFLNRLVVMFFSKTADKYSDTGFDFVRPFITLVAVRNMTYKDLTDRSPNSKLYKGQVYRIAFVDAAMVTVKDIISMAGYSNQTQAVRLDSLIQAINGRFSGDSFIVRLEAMKANFQGGLTFQAVNAVGFDRDMLGYSQAIDVESGRIIDIPTQSAQGVYLLTDGQSTPGYDLLFYSPKKDLSSDAAMAIDSRVVEKFQLTAKDVKLFEAEGIGALAVKLEMNVDELVKQIKGKPALGVLITRRTGGDSGVREYYGERYYASTAESLDSSDDSAMFSTMSPKVAGVVLQQLVQVLGSRIIADGKDVEVFKIQADLLTKLKSDNVDSDNADNQKSVKDLWNSLREYFVRADMYLDKYFIIELDRNTPKSVFLVDLSDSNNPRTKVASIVGGETELDLKTSEFEVLLAEGNTQGFEASFKKMFDEAMLGLDMKMINTIFSKGTPTKNFFAKLIVGGMVVQVGIMIGSLAWTLSDERDKVNDRMPIVQPAASNNEGDTVGGIDLNAANLDLRIKRDGKGVPLPLSNQDMNQLMSIEGFIPVIINIKPILNTPILSELTQTQDVHS